ncbi:MAG: bifunctional UDP-N-acetylglucosamine diphosphorylase/glucosamine-1-phosphate N-acetyltransferase GlmU [Bdellovibrionales bacterium]
MNKQPLAIVILAAGKGTRMKSGIPKVMHDLAGLPMIRWLLKSCEALNPDKIITVIGPDMDDLAAAVAPYETTIQAERNGTAGAVKAALPALAGFNGKVLILMGDEPLVTQDTLAALVAHNGLCVQGFHTVSPFGLGRMVLNDDGTLNTIIEDKDCSEIQRLITLCNAGNYCVPADRLAGWIDQIGNDNAQGEYYLTDLPAIAARDGVPTKVIETRWSGPWGVNDRIQLAAHEAKLQNHLREAAMRDGVHLQDPDSVYFHYDTELAAGVRVEPNVYFGAGVRVEKDVTIKAFSHIEGAHIQSGAVIGPFARIRPQTQIGRGVRVGNFVEIKKSIIGTGSKINHHAYVGDCTMGRDVNFSCGAITVNYDGFEKHKTILGDGVMVGSNVSLIAPITIGDGAFLAAGSTLTENVEKDALSMSRAKTSIKKGWAARYRAIKAAAKKTALLLVVFGCTSPALACDGFEDSMKTLEGIVGVPNPAPPQTPVPSAPPRR